MTKLHILNYITDPVCMGLALHDEDEPNGIGEVFTVNLGDMIGNQTIMPRFAAYMDVNNYPGVIEALETEGLIKPFMRFGHPVTAGSGWVEYPLYTIEEKFLDEDEVKEYLKNYDEAFKVVYDNYFGDMSYLEEL